MAYKLIEDTIIQKVYYKNETFAQMFYDGVRFWKTKFGNCTWHDCKFYRISFAHHTFISKCRFENCQFWGQLSYRGGPSRFEDCEFLDCEFKNIQFWDTEFVNCLFTGKFHKLDFHGPQSPGVWATVLQDVDFSGVQMEETNFRAGIDLSTTKLPGNIAPV